MQRTILGTCMIILIRTQTTTAAILLLLPLAVLGSLGQAAALLPLGLPRGVVAGLGIAKDGRG